MPARPVITEHDATLLADLGERVRLARLRRRLSAQELALRAGITRATLHRLESGAPAVTLGTATKVLRVLGMAQDLVMLVRDDRVGQQLLDARLPARRPPAAPGKIRLAELPQLRELARHLVDEHIELTPVEAFELYERNWRHIDRDKLTDKESRMIERLTKSVGRGVMLV